MVSFMVFVFGLAIGSFLSAFVYRLERGENILYGRSYCPQCKHPLAWHDLIPLLSFLFLKGKCRYCKGRISLQDSLIELAAGILFLLVFLFVFSEGVIPGEIIQQVLRLVYVWTMGSLLLVIFVYDLKYSLIPDTIVYTAILISVVWYVLVFGMFFNPWSLQDMLRVLIASFGAGAFFWVIHAVSRGTWMGFGDVKLAFLLGLFLGLPSMLVALFFAFSLGAIVGLLLIALKKKGLKSEVPFAPFLIIGTAVAFFFGERVLSWYLGLFLV